MERKGRSNRRQRGLEFHLKQPFQGCSYRWIFDGAMASAIQRAPRLTTALPSFKNAVQFSSLPIGQLEGG